MDIIVWTQDPNAKLSTFTGHTDNVSQRKRKGNSSPSAMDLISPKMRNLPKFLNVNQSIRSTPPLIGWPQVAPQQNSKLRRSGLNPKLERVQPDSINATVAELTFCVDQPESSPVSGSVSVEPSDHSISSTTMPKSIDTSSQSSSQTRIAHSVHLRNKATAKPVSKKSITSNVVSQRPLKPRISQLSDIRPSPLQPIISQPFGVRVSSLNPVIVESNSLVTSSLQPRLIQASGIRASSLQPSLIQAVATMASTMQPKLNQSSNMTPILQPRLIQASGMMAPSLQPRLIQGSGMMAPTLQPGLIQAAATMSSSLQPGRIQAAATMASTMPPRLIRASGMMTSTLRPRILQSSGIRTSPTRMVNSPRMLIIRRPLRPQSLQSRGPGTLSATMVNPAQIIPTAQRPLHPRFVQSGSLRISPAGMFHHPERIIGRNVSVQRPMMPRIVGSPSDRFLIFNDIIAQRPSLPGSVQSSGISPVRAIKPEEITVTPDVFPHRILQSGSMPLITSSSPIVAPETIISDVAAQNDSRQSSSATDILQVDLNLVKMEAEESDPCDTA